MIIPAGNENLLTWILFHKTGLELLATIPVGVVHGRHFYPLVVQTTLYGSGSTSAHGNSLDCSNLPPRTSSSLSPRLPPNRARPVYVSKKDHLRDPPSWAHVFPSTCETSPPRSAHDPVFGILSTSPHNPLSGRHSRRPSTNPRRSSLLSVHPPLGTVLDFTTTVTLSSQLHPAAMYHPHQPHRPAFRGGRPPVLPPPPPLAPRSKPATPRSSKPLTQTQRSLQRQWT